MPIALSLAELRAVTAFAIACARPALAIYERAHPRDRRPHAAIEAAAAFAAGGPRTKSIRDGAWAALRAARESKDPAAQEAARAASHAAGAAYLHPLAKATQVLHILGSAATAARAFELSADAPAVGIRHVRRAAKRASVTVIRVLRRYPAAPSGRGRVGELVRALDGLLRPGVTAALQRSTSRRRSRA